MDEKDQVSLSESFTKGLKRRYEHRMEEEKARERLLALLDEETKKAIVDAAEQEIGFNYDFYAERQRCLQEIGLNYDLYAEDRRSLLEIQGYYLSWHDSNLYIGSPMVADLTYAYPHMEKDLIKIESATKKYEKALGDCGFLGEITFKAAEPVMKLIHGFRKLIEFDKKNLKKMGIDRYAVKRGNPGDNRLRVYIYWMACWYRRSVGKKPSYGANSIFPGLVSACLAIIDDDWKEKGPPYKPIRHVLKRLEELKIDLD